MANDAIRDHLTLSGKKVGFEHNYSVYRESLFSLPANHHTS